MLQQKSHKNLEQKVSQAAPSALNFALKNLEQKLEQAFALRIALKNLEQAML